MQYRQRKISHYRPTKRQTITHSSFQNELTPQPRDAVYARNTNLKNLVGGEFIAEVEGLRLPPSKGGKYV